MVSLSLNFTTRQSPHTLRLSAALAQKSEIYMAGRKKAEFTDKTKRTLAGRAGYQCSFPDCQLFLIGPHSDGEKTVSLGVAAHIKGAALGSARYDESQTDEERKHISNGIWMCQNHSVQIDNDENLYPLEKLLEWRRKREESARSEFASKANLPQMPTSFARPEDRHRLDTDGKYRSNGLIVSFDPWKSFEGEITMVKLSVEGEIESQEQLVNIAVSSVQAYLVSVGLRGQYLHILAQMRGLKFHPISQSHRPEWAVQFQQFKDHILGIDWSDVPGMEGAVFDLIAGNTKGTGEWDTFIIDITSLYPDMYSDYIDRSEA